MVDAAAITLPDDADFIHMHLNGGFGDEFGMFEDDHASSSLAMAVEAHDSFMMIDDISGLLGSQVSADEEHFMVCSAFFFIFFLVDVLIQKILF